MNETASLQKQDLHHINYKLNEIAELLERIIKLLEANIPTDTIESKNGKG